MMPEHIRTQCEIVEKQAQDDWDSGLKKFRDDRIARLDVPQCIMNGRVLRPIEYKVLVKPDLIEETDDAIKRFKALGMELPDAEKERDKQRQITGTLIAIGGLAFDGFGDPMPKVGDKVYFAKYAGLVIRDDDKAEFRLMNDKDITGVLV